MNGNNDITYEDACTSLQSIANTMDGQIFLAYWFRKLGDGATLYHPDPRIQEQNVARHDDACDLRTMMKHK